MPHDTLTAPDREETAYVVPPVQRAFRLLRYIADGNRCQNISVAAKETGLNRTTLIRLLNTLVLERMIEKRIDGSGYFLSFGLMGLAAEAMFSRDVVQNARPVLERLATELELSAHLAVLDGREIVYLGRATPNAHLVSNVRVGTRLPSHATSIGRIILAHLPTEDVRAIFGQEPLAAYSEQTATSVDALLVQIGQDRVRGLAWSRSNYEAGLGSGAAAVFDHSGAPVAGINVTGHETHFAVDTARRQQIASALLAAADDISRSLGHSGPRQRPTAEE
ncbi:MAG: IclR family transcriptional regulator [Rhodobacteraceae bacterium]|nr:IclR family transcriptional regulator [Paracoccaceae bacterium]